MNTHEKPRRNQSREGKCCIKNCDRDIISRRMCIPHYYRWRQGKRGSELEKPIRRLIKNKGKKCKQAKCGAMAEFRGYCVRHYRRHINGFPMSAPFRCNNQGKVCLIEGCEQPAKAKLMCGRHYISQWQKENRKKKGKPRRSIEDLDRI